ncbi:hypothetical protein CO669_12365 [Bradyrhizobium sp. Y36]|nr:hypothetical protein CO669_12365 [Bradyrhizobium sp. Y36]
MLVMTFHAAQRENIPSAVVRELGTRMSLMRKFPRTAWQNNVPVLAVAIKRQRAGLALSIPLGKAQNAPAPARLPATV